MVDSIDRESRYARNAFPGPLIEELVAKSGAEFDARLRAAGVVLPTGPSATELLRVVLEERRAAGRSQTTDSQSTGLQFGLSEIVSIITSAAGELPNGKMDLGFKALVLRRVREWAAGKNFQRD
jgi:hypothetical protein